MDNCFTKQIDYDLLLLFFFAADFFLNGLKNFQNYKQILLKLTTNTYVFWRQDMGIFFLNLENHRHFRQ